MIGMLALMLVLFLALAAFVAWPLLKDDPLPSAPAEGKPPGLSGLNTLPGSGGAGPRLPTLPPAPGGPEA